MNNLRRCTRCMLPETYETIEFDDEGICNICRSTSVKQDSVDWAERKVLLDNLIAKYRDIGEYDCIVPFSGGKDSTYQLWYLMTQYKLKPLVVRFNHGFLRPTIQKNVERTLKKLGADFIDFTPNWKIVKRVMLESFVRKTDFCWHCHSGIYSYPLQIAIKFNIPLIFWGEPLAEISHYYDYLSDEIEWEDETKFNMCRNLGITAEDMYGMINSPENPVDRRDLNPFTYPPLKELKRIGYCSVCLGSFIPWDYVSQNEIIKSELGWQTDLLEGVDGEINAHGEKIECFMQGARDYIKFLKRGYTRTSQISAFHIRNGRFNKDRLIPLIENEGKRPPSLDVLLGYLGMEEEEFNTIVKGMTVPPYQHDYDNNGQSEPLWDSDQWYREDNRSAALNK